MPITPANPVAIGGSAVKLDLATGQIDFANKTITLVLNAFDSSGNVLEQTTVSVPSQAAAAFVGSIRTSALTAAQNALGIAGTVS